MNTLQRSICNIRKNALRMALEAGNSGSHVGGSFSCLEILAVLYGRILNYDLKNKRWNERDRFLASKAHCILTHYAALAEFGFLEAKDLSSFRENDGLLAGHPTNLDIGLEFSGGSLGMGLSVGIGMAITAKERGENHRIFVLLGDGECNEGAVWEAIMSAPKFCLDNLTAIVDYNNMQFDGTNEEIMNIYPLKEKFRLRGGNVMSNLEKYIHAFVESLEVSADSVEDLEYQGIEQWDSVGHMGIIAAMEDAFGIMMDTDDVIEFSSFKKGREILTRNYGIEF